MGIASHICYDVIFRRYICLKYSEKTSKMRFFGGVSQMQNMCYDYNS